MKNLAILVFILMISVLFSSCQKEDLINTNNSFISSNNKLLLNGSVFDPYFLVNENNRYDEFGIEMNKFYNDLIFIYMDSMYNDYNLFEKELDDIIIKHKENMYPAFDTTNYSEYESSIINDFINNVNLENLKETSLFYENVVIIDNNLSVTQKNRLLEFISFYKFVYYYQNEIIILCKATWEDRWNDCMYRELGEIFKDDGNPLPEIVYISGAPINTLQLAAICAWEATFHNDK